MNARRLDFPSISPDRQKAIDGQKGLTEAFFELINLAYRQMDTDESALETTLRMIEGFRQTYGFLLQMPDVKHASDRLEAELLLEAQRQSALASTG